MTTNLLIHAQPRADGRSLPRAVCDPREKLSHWPEGHYLVAPVSTTPGSTNQSCKEAS